MLQKLTTRTDLKEMLFLMALSCAGGGVFAIVQAENDYLSVIVKILSLVAIYYSCIKTNTSTEALLCGFIWGGTAGVINGSGWLKFGLMHTFELSASASWFWVAVLALYTSTFTAAATYFYKLFSLKYGFQALVFTTFWILFELARSHLLSGVPWMTLGYSFLVSPFTGIASIFGVFGISAVSLLFAVGCLELFTKKYISGIAMLIASTLTPYCLGLIEFTDQKGSAVEIAALQGNIPVTLKPTFNDLAMDMAVYIQLIKQSEKENKPSIILLPEAAIRASYQLIPKTILPIMQPAHATLLLSTYWRADINSDIRKSDNEYSSRMISTNPNQVWHYDKIKALPFGESIPHGFNFIYNMLKLPVSNLLEGSAEQGNFYLDGIYYAPSICIETSYPHMLRNNAAKANVILNTTNIAWYGETNIITWYANTLKVLALSFQKPVISAGNNTGSMHVDSKGNVLKILDNNKRDVLHASVQPTAGQTPYNLFGDWLLFFICLSFLIILVFRDIYKKYA